MAAPFLVGLSAASVGFVSGASIGPPSNATVARAPLTSRFDLPSRVSTVVSRATLGDSLSDVAASVASRADVAGNHIVPRITREPKSAAVLAGGTARFIASATGSPVPKIRWELERQGGHWVRLGAHSRVLSVRARLSENGYRYRAVFTNAAGAVGTRAVVLRVKLKSRAPVITEQPTSVAVASGGQASFSAAASGVPSPAAQWQYSTNGGATWAAIPGADSSSLSFVVNLAENAYEYEVVFTNEAGSATSSFATLSVPTAPAITSQPSSQFVRTGSSATLAASASGSPTPSVQWDESTNGGSSFAAILGATSPTYSLTNATVSESGDEFEAVFTNSAGSATTQPAVVSIADATSNNWSGYAIEEGTGTFSDIRGSWTVASVSCPQNASAYSSAWIGIDGYGSSTVEQDGTDSDCNNGVPNYYAWYEMYPQAAVQITSSTLGLVGTGTVQAGDSMSAHVSYDVSTTTWTLALSDTTQNWTFSTTIIDGLLSRSSIEWIVERPEVCNPTCSLTSLSDFSTFTMTGATAQTGTVSPESGVSIDMVGNDSSTVLSRVGSLSTDGESFSVTWQNSGP